MMPGRRGAGSQNTQVSCRDETKVSVHVVHWRGCADHDAGGSALIPAAHPHPHNQTATYHAACHFTHTTNRTIIVVSIPSRPPFSLLLLIPFSVRCFQRNCRAAMCPAVPVSPVLAYAGQVTEILPPIHLNMLLDL
jgi:hypothetical protein